MCFDEKIFDNTLIVISFTTPVDKVVSSLSRSVLIAHSTVVFSFCVFFNG